MFAEEGVREGLVDPAVVAAAAAGKEEVVFFERQKTQFPQEPLRLVRKPREGKSASSAVFLQKIHHR